MKPNKLDSKFSLAKHVVIETKAQDMFSLINVDMGATLVCSAKYLKHASSKSIDNDSKEEMSTNHKESNNKKLYRNDSSAKVSDVCDHTEPSGCVDEQASQNERVITRSGRVVKSTKHCDNFVHYWHNLIANVVICSIHLSYILRTRLQRM